MSEETAKAPIMNPAEVLAVLDSEISVCQASLAPLKNPDARWVFEDNLRRLTSARTAVAALIAERDALREDAERLNWIDATGFSDFRECDTRTGLSSHCIIIREGGRSLGGGPNIPAGIRATIDAARAEAGHG